MRSTFRPAAVLSGIFAALIAVVLCTADSSAQTPAPAAQALSAAELAKVDGLIAQQGREIAVAPIITDILGLTKNSQTLSCRAFAAEGTGDEIHQIYALPEDKGYLDAHFYQNKLDIYWTDKSFALKAALTGVRGQMPAAANYADAQYGFAFEVAWWSKFVAAH